MRPLHSVLCLFSLLQCTLTHAFVAFLLWLVMVIVWSHLRVFIGTCGFVCDDVLFSSLIQNAGTKYPCKDPVASPNVPLAILYHQLNDAETEMEKTDIRTQLAEELLVRYLLPILQSA